MTYQWWSLLPFVAMLGCIALLPIIPATAHWWERASSQLIIALALGAPTTVWMFLGAGSSPLIATGVEYAQFIVLLFALFTVSGGIHLDGDIKATPRNNTIFLAVGGLLASFVGTTGAAMLLIRPLLATNKERVHRVHTVLFTIFVVANCGGLLTPLGDPPLFPRHEEVELSWMILDPVEEFWASGGRPEQYTPGTWGPASADALMARDGRVWRRP